MFVLNRWYNFLIVMAVYWFFFAVWVTTIIMFPFMIAWSYYQLVNMKGLYITKKTRCFLHENTYMYPLDLINLHFWRVPMSVSWSVCVSAKEESRENGCAYQLSPALCGLYYLAVSGAKMLHLRTAFWLADAPLRLISNIGGYQESKGVPLSAVWSAYVFYEENHNGWL